MWFNAVILVLSVKIVPIQHGSDDDVELGAFFHEISKFINPFKTKKRTKKLIS